MHTRTQRWAAACAAFAAVSFSLVTAFVDAAPAIGAAERLVDTRSGGTTSDGDYAGGGAIRAGETLRFEVAGRGGLDRNVGVAALNIVAVNPHGSGYLTMWDCAEPRPTISVLNYDDGVIANLALVRPAGNGDVCVYSSATTDLVVDVSGSFGGTDLAVTDPGRFLDTRRGALTVDTQGLTGQQLQPGQVLRVPVSGRASIGNSDGSVVVNIAAARASAPGFITAYGCDSAPPSTSNLNYDTRMPISRLSIIELDDSGEICLTSSTRTDAIVDVYGLVNPGAFAPVEPARLLESRSSGTTTDGESNGIGRLYGGSVVNLQVTGRAGVPDGVTGVLLQVVAARPAAQGYVTVWGGSADNPGTSSVNYTSGVTVGNAVMSSVSADGSLCAYVSAETDLVIDVLGYFVGGEPASGDSCEEQRTTPPSSGGGGGGAVPGTMKLPGIENSLGSGGASNSFLRQSGGGFGSYNGTGEVRITCGIAHNAYDDPIVSYGQPGGSHLHTFFGNAGTNANSTYESLRNEPRGSTCAGGAVNKSAYWFPSLIDSSSNSVVEPTLAFVYYKTGYWGQDGRTIQDIPNGLRMVSGTAGTSGPQEEWIVHWACTSHNGDGVPLGGIRSGSSIPRCDNGDLLGASIMFPQCWNGRDLDSPDHKSHMAHPNFQGQCPGSHPVLLPQITVNVTWAMGSSGTNGMYLASDMMTPADAPPGMGLHADFFEAWDPASRSTFVENCLNGQRDCGVRSLGDGNTLLDPPSSSRSAPFIG